MEGIKCNEVMGAMYAFPNVSIPKRAQEEAKVNDNYLIWTLDLVLKIRILWSPLQCTLQSEHVVWQIQTSAVTVTLDGEFFCSDDDLRSGSHNILVTVSKNGLFQNYLYPKSLFNKSNITEFLLSL